MCKRRLQPKEKMSSRNARVDYRKARQSPTEKSSEYSLGHEKRGLDGRMWKVVRLTNKQMRWQRVSATTEETAKEMKTPRHTGGRRTVKRRVEGRSEYAMAKDGSANEIVEESKTAAPSPLVVEKKVVEITTAEIPEIVQDKAGINARKAVYAKYKFERLSYDKENWAVYEHKRALETKENKEMLKCIQQFTSNQYTVAREILNAALFHVPRPPFPFYVYRGLTPSADYPRTRLLALNRPGLDVTFPQISSTSLDPSIAYGFSGQSEEDESNWGIFYKILVPADFPCLFLKAWSQFDVEDEVLLPAFASLRVTKVYSARLPVYPMTEERSTSYSLTRMEVVEVVASYRREAPSSEVDWRKCIVVPPET